MDVRRNKWRKDGEHFAGVCSPPSTYRNVSSLTTTITHKQGGIMAITGSSITQTMGTSALDTQTPLQIRRSTQSGCDSGQQRGSWMPIGESLFDSRCGKRFFPFRKASKTGSRYDLGSYSTGTRSLFSLRETAGA